MNLIIGIILAFIGVFFLWFIMKKPYSKEFSDAEFAGYLYGFFFLIAGLYFIVLFIMELLR